VGWWILLSIESLLSNGTAFSIHWVSIIGHHNNAAATNQKSKESGGRMLLTIESISCGSAVMEFSREDLIRFGRIDLDRIVVPVWQQEQLRATFCSSCCVAAAANAVHVNVVFLSLAFILSSRDTRVCGRVCVHVRDYPQLWWSFALLPLLLSLLLSLVGPQRAGPSTRPIAPCREMQATRDPALRVATSALCPPSLMGPGLRWQWRWQGQRQWLAEHCQCGRRRCQRETTAGLAAAAVPKG